MNSILCRNRRMLNAIGQFVTKTLLHAILRLANRVPNRLESLLLSRVRASLDHSPAAILCDQIASINRIQRDASRREVRFYRMKRRRVDWQGVRLFPLQDLETKLATIAFLRAGKPEKPVRVEFWLVKGHLFSIDFDSPPGNTSDTSDIRVQAVEIHVDPMRPSINVRKTQSATAGDPRPLTGWVAAWCRQYGASDLRTPVSADERQRCLNEFETVFPEDYLDLLQQTDGLLVRDSSVLGVLDIYPIAWEDDDFCLIAEVAGGKGNQEFLGVKRGCKDGDIYYLVHDGPPPMRLGNSFTKAMERFLTSGDQDHDGVTKHL